MMGGGKCLTEFFVFWKVYLFILVPIIFCPLVTQYAGDTHEKAARCGYVVCIMACYWLFDVLPLAVVSLLPMVLFPMLEVVKVSEVATNYLKDTNMVFLGGLILAVSIEHSGLHKRIALGVLVCLGPHPMALLAGFMLPTWFLTMWISNTACTAMMIPVVGAVLAQVKLGLMKQYGLDVEDLDEKDVLSADQVEVMVVDSGRLENMQVPMETISANVDEYQFNRNHFQNGIKENNGDLPAQIKRKQSVMSPSEERKLAEFYKSKMYERYKSFNQALTLAIAYAANVGGNGTLTGTPPNLVCKQQIDELWKRYNNGTESPVNFGSWMAWSIPESAINLVICYLWLVIVFLWRDVFRGCKEKCNCACPCIAKDDFSLANNTAGVKQIIRSEYENLGKIRFNEIGNILFFCLLVSLWLSRNPGGGGGWGQYFDGYVSDSVPALAVGVLLHIFPSEIPKFFCCKKPGEKARTVPALLSWDVVSKNLAWGPIILLGGGFAMADACVKSGLSQLIADQMVALGSVPPWVMVLGITTLVAVTTEITSNTATTVLLLPILGDLAIKIGVNPLYLMMPATLAASYAFMLPVATAPNAIVYAYGELRVIDMVKTGFFMNICCVLVNLLATHTWGMVLFDLDTYPFPQANNTAVI